MRLDRLLANSGYGSRTEVKKLIKSGKVSVENEVQTDCGLDLNESLNHSISIEGINIKTRKNLHYMLNKPSEYLTALEDKRKPTIAQFIPQNLLNAGIFPVGRLDIDTTGLLIITNDGTLCHRLTSPKWHIDKRYYFEVDGKYLDDSDISKLHDGLVLQDGTKCKSADLEIKTSCTGFLTIREGKYHQVKKMMKALGGTVTVLKRESMGPIILDENLSEGQIRELTSKEINALYEAVNLGPSI